MRNPLNEFVIIYILIIDSQSTGVGAVGRCTDLLVACHVVVYGKEKKTYKCQVNRVMFVWIPVSSRWRYRYDTVLMHGGIQGDIVYMCDEFGVHGKLYVEVIRTSCFMAKHENRLDHNTQLLIFKVWGWYWVNWKSVVFNLSICSSLKYTTWKWIKMGVKWELWIKIAYFLVEWQFGTSMFFCASDHDT